MCLRFQCVVQQEFVNAKSAAEQIIELNQTLRYIQVPIKSKTFMFGDNNLLSPAQQSHIPY